MESCISHLFKLLKSADKESKNLLGNLSLEIITRGIDNNKDLPSSFHSTSKFFPEKVKENIKDTSSYMYTINKKIKKKEITINFISPQKINHSTLQNYYHYCFLWLYFIITTKETNNCCNTLNIDIYLTDVAKKLPEYRTIVLGPEHVNSAYTYTCRENNEIIIYRNEEWLKVFIHETFHAFRLDFSGQSVAKYEDQIKSSFNINTTILLYETYSEVWARIFTVIFVIYMKKPNIKFSAFYKRFVREMQQEAFFSIMQSCKILHFMGLNYSLLISKDHDEKNCSLRLYKEKTNVFCYYILTSILLFFLDDFMVFCEKNNNNIFLMKKNEKNIQLFINFIKERYDNKTLIELYKECNKTDYDDSLKMLGFDLYL